MLNYINLSKIIFLACFLYLLPYASDASQTQPIRVGVVSLSPFSTPTSNVHYKGIATDIWENIADAGGINYVYVPLSEDVNADLQLLQEHKIDVIVGPITITHNRLKIVNFSVPYYESSMGAIIPAKLDIFALLHFLFVGSLWFILLGLLSAYLVYINLMWYFERGKLSDLPTNYSKAMSNAIWFQLLGKGFGFPSTTAGRVIAAMWLLFTLLTFSSFNASLASVFTVALEKAYRKTTALADYKDKTIIIVEGTSYVENAKQMGLTIKTAPSLETAFTMLKNKEGQAIFADMPVAQYFLTQQKEKKKFVASQVLPTNFLFAFVVPQNSPLLPTINNNLTAIQGNLDAQYICNKYLSDDQSIHCLA